MSDQSQISKARAFWNKKSVENERYQTDSDRKRTNWRDIKPVLEYINVQKSGVPNRNFTQLLADRYKFKRGLSLGCGTGRYERSIVNSGLCDELIGVDLAPNAVEIANSTQGNERLRFQVGDFLDPKTFEIAEFDVIFMSHSLHHVVAVEELFENMCRVLPAEGRFITEDYFGATRWQWSRPHLAVLQEVLDSLPDQYKRLVDAEPPQFRRKLTRHDAVKLSESDPTESVRSGELMNLLGDYFDIELDRGHHGTLIFPLFHRTSGCFDEEDERDMALVRLIIMLERQLMQSGTLPPLFRSIVAKPRELLE